MAMYNPPHPGEFLQEVYLKPLELSSRQVAIRLRVSPSTLGRLLRKQSRITPAMALRLSTVLGRSPESWLALQDNYDLWKARRQVNLEGLEKLVAVKTLQRTPGFV